MAATRLTLERQVTVIREQLASVVEMMQRYMPQNSVANGDAIRSLTPRTGASPTGPARVQQCDLEANLEAAMNGKGRLNIDVNLGFGNEGKAMHVCTQRRR
ncbi:unnamed protein product [Arabis nemorensis]|uniref:Uncharacterized protein n=1 Tax=Arabis nemorensis TaxID=586526 RepID=A0A565AUX8_9BRAS|nr:unnamed protein product [Arabis nemorensis]